MSIEYVMTVTSAESHAAVIADMRKKYPASPNCEPTVSGQFVHDEMVWLANRLEAAHERELAERGDAAKLREALTDAEKTLYDSSRSMYGIPPHLHALLARIRAALAAPPRNCDVARDWVCDLYAHFQPPASVKREMPPEWVDAVMAFCRWLLAPATEKEGENDGSK